MMLRMLFGFIRSLFVIKEVPPEFTAAIEKACQRIIERERIENEWKEVWAQQGRIECSSDARTM